MIVAIVCLFGSGCGVLFECLQPVPDLPVALLFIATFLVSIAAVAAYVRADVLGDHPRERRR